MRSRSIYLALTNRVPGGASNPAPMTPKLIAMLAALGLAPLGAGAVSSDTFGSFVRTQKEEGLRGRELADAIHAEQEARGMRGSAPDDDGLDDEDEREGHGKAKGRDEDRPGKGKAHAKGKDKDKADEAKPDKAKGKPDKAKGGHGKRK